MKDESTMSAKLQDPGCGQPSLSPAPGKAGKTNFRLPIAVVLATIESSRDMYVMVISKKAGSVLTRATYPFSKKDKRRI
jgi:hypothetical protein